MAGDACTVLHVGLVRTSYSLPPMEAESLLRGRCLCRKDTGPGPGREADPPGIFDPEAVSERGV